MLSQTIRSALRRNLSVQTPRISNVTKSSSLILKSSFSSQARLLSDHHEETFEEFTARYEKEFETAYDLFEVQRILNNCFAYDLVPAPVVIEKALQACRRVNDYPTAVRTFEALKYKVETKEQYQAYLEELKDIRKELGIDLKEELYGESA